jgi:hypothetical protein
MLTKEELLAKGVSEPVADEIIAALSDGNAEENSLQALQKALDDTSGGMEELFKAEDGGKKDEDDDEDYNPEYMKKYMKRFMKENKKSCAATAKEVGIFGDKMQKAIDEINPDADGAVIDMVDLKPFLEAQTDLNESLVKAISDMSSQILVISAQNQKSFDIMKKAAVVTAEQAISLGDFLGKPQGRKGLVATDMKKAAQVINSDGNKAIYNVLMKATKDGDTTAGQIISAFESCGKDANKLNAAQKNYINEILQKEVK